ncbi:MAG: CpsB/CapC family capsule biosynthesis tyrosine phosphatase [Coprococcus sp.]
MIDLHTHILPEIDDGSRSVEMSLKLLQMEQKQKAGTVVLHSFLSMAGSAGSFF